MHHVTYMLNLLPLVKIRRVFFLSGGGLLHYANIHFYFVKIFVTCPESDVFEMSSAYQWTATCGGKSPAQ